MAGENKLRCRLRILRKKKLEIPRCKFGIASKSEFWLLTFFPQNCEFISLISKSDFAYHNSKSQNCKKKEEEFVFLFVAQTGFHRPLLEWLLKWYLFTKNMTFVLFIIFIIIILLKIF